MKEPIVLVPVLCTFSLDTIAANYTLEMNNVPSSVKDLESNNTSQIVWRKIIIIWKSSITDSVPTHAFLWST